MESRNPVAPLNRIRSLVLTAGMGLALLATACGAAPAAQPGGSGSQPTMAPAAVARATPTIQPTPAPTATAVPTATPSPYANLSGMINIDGSSTVFPITEAVAEEFGKLTAGKVRVVVGVSGTGGGFSKFCAGETDISNASRPIKASEAEACAKAGIEYIELPVAIDGLTVMVNPQNSFIQCLTVAKLKTIWEPGAEGKITRWNQVQPEWPNATIRLYGPGTDSGTFDYFTEVVNGKVQASRGDYTASEDDNVLVQGIAGDKNALGYFGYSYYVENPGKLKAVAIDGGAGCISPTQQTINDGTYKPLSRPLFVYIRKEAAAKPHVKEFVQYYLSQPGRKLVGQVGYIPFSDKVYELAAARFQKRALGTIFGGATPQKGAVESVLAAQ